MKIFLSVLLSVFTFSISFAADCGKEYPNEYTKEYVTAILIGENADKELKKMLETLTAIGIEPKGHQEEYDGEVEINISQSEQLISKILLQGGCVQFDQKCVNQIQRLNSDLEISLDGTVHKSGIKILSGKIKVPARVLSFTLSGKNWVEGYAIFGVANKISPLVAHQLLTTLPWN